MLEPLVKKLRNRGLAWPYIATPLQFGNLAGAFGLGFPLGSPERVPLALAFAGFGVAKIEDDGPVARRAFADVALTAAYGPNSGKSRLPATMEPHSRVPRDQLIKIGAKINSRQRRWVA